MEFDLYKGKTTLPYKYEGARPIEASTIESNITFIYFYAYSISQTLILLSTPNFRFLSTRRLPKELLVVCRH